MMCCLKSKTLLVTPRTGLFTDSFHLTWAVSLPGLTSWSISLPLCGVQIPSSFLKILLSFCCHDTTLTSLFSLFFPSLLCTLLIYLKCFVFFSHVECCSHNSLLSRCLFSLPAHFLGGFNYTHVFVTTSTQRAPRAASAPAGPAWNFRQPALLLCPCLAWWAPLWKPETRVFSI